MKEKSEKLLPKILPGAVCAQMIRCGKANCKCARGELHGPFFYRFWREDGRLRKEYVRKIDVVITQAACDARREEARAVRQAGCWSMGHWRELQKLLREYSRL